MRVLTLFIGAFASSAAYAAPTADLTLNLTGQISQSCTIEQRSGPVNVVLTDGPGAYNIDYQVNCNTPMAVKLTSQKGGFEHDQYRTWPDSPGFTGLIKYDAEFQLDVDGAAPVNAESDQMLAGVTGATGVTPFQADARLHLSWTPEGTLFGGRYQDTIIIRVFGEGA